MFARSCADNKPDLICDYHMLMAYKKNYSLFILFFLNLIDAIKKKEYIVIRSLSKKKKSLKICLFNLQEF